METKFKVEFNEKQQVFHCEMNCNEKTPDGWVTIFEKCTNDDFIIFEAYVNRIKQNNITLQYLLQSKKEVAQFQKELKKEGVKIILK